MEIRIWLDQRRPPAGRLRQVDYATSDRDEIVPFSGWLGLLRALQDLLHDADNAGTQTPPSDPFRRDSS